MTDERKKKIAGLVWSLAQTAKNCGHARGLRSGLNGDGWFNPGVNPEDVIQKDEAETEEIMNELFAALGMRDYQEHNYTEE